MGSSKAKTPPDPDPTPTPAADINQEVQGAARQERKRQAKNYGRQQTILAGDSSQANEAKKTILGG